MQAGKIVLILAGLILCSYCKAQNRVHFNMKLYPVISRFNINKKSSGYDKDWDKASLQFKSKVGFGAGLGVEYFLSDKLAAFFDVRYNYWGGTIEAGSDIPNTYLNEEVTYQSINIPLGLKYYYFNSNRFKLFVGMGAGIDHSYKVSFIPSNYYGSHSPEKSKADIRTLYLLLSLGTEYRINSRMNGFVGIEVNNDMLLNPNRMQDYLGFYAQQMPLNYNLFALIIGLKI